MYKQGFEKGVQEADTNFRIGAAEPNHVNSKDIDCDSDVDPLAVNEDYCNGNTDGYAFEMNRLTGK
jgi:hypothetical protein